MAGVWSLEAWKAQEAIKQVLWVSLVLIALMKEFKNFIDL